MEVEPMDGKALVFDTPKANAEEPASFMPPTEGMSSGLKPITPVSPVVDIFEWFAQMQEFTAREVLKQVGPLMAPALVDRHNLMADQMFAAAGAWRRRKEAGK